MTLPTPDTIAAWLPRQRWFGAKSRRIRGVTFADAVPLGEAVVLLVDVDLDVGDRERYAIPSMARADVTDALADAGFCRALLQLVSDARAVAGDRGQIRGVPAAALAERWPAGPPARLAVHRLGGEQSNTSVVLGDAFVMKHFRKLAAGLNPEAEIARFLTERTEFRHTPRLAGHVEYREGDGTTTTLAVIQALIPDALDGWQWVLARLGEPGGPDGAVRALGRLGQRTGELHQALAGDGSDPAFAPEPITAADVSAWSDAVLAQVAAAARAVSSGEEVSVDGDRVRAALGGLLGRLKIRHHGDFHLGQTLYRATAADWMVIDFEGEPLRSLDERRRKHAAPRDVAGMLRSIDYAAVSASERAATLTAWQAAAADAFVAGYRGATGDAGFAPESDAAFGDVVSVFELEKAAYEIVYEANNRPDWIEIPKRGFLTAAARLGRRRVAGRR